MSITWTVSHPLRLVIATGKGEVTATDILFYVDEIGKAGAISYRKLLDLTGVAIAMPQADVRSIGTRFASRAGDAQLGPSAVVVGSDAFVKLAKVFDAAAQLNRPLRIFRDRHTAREWLDEVAPVAARDGPSN
jgi:hypothetical protein